MGPLSEKMLARWNQSATPLANPGPLLKPPPGLSFPNRIVLPPDPPAQCSVVNDPANFNPSPETGSAPLSSSRSKPPQT